MASKQRFSVSEILTQVFDSESDIEENVSETEDNLEEDPDYEASSSDENETPSVDPPVFWASCCLSTISRHITFQK
ncbi:hypothetical protein QQF64_023573 [Cirrhinus molitorella]|uniref:Uncharacterized protein n=1 Tax=Cirrhinus molitorella TaxID=172907 RepID=A0ABR3NIT2_9TELE